MAEIVVNCSKRTDTDSLYLQVQHILNLTHQYNNNNNNNNNIIILLCTLCSTSLTIISLWKINITLTVPMSKKKTEEVTQ